jgi:hypothetical protein
VLRGKENLKNALEKNQSKKLPRPSRFINLWFIEKKPMAWQV